MFKSLGYSPQVVYHYTRKANVTSILDSKEIKRFKDTYTFFTETEELADWLIRNVTCNSNCATIDFDGIPKANRNNIEDFCILKLTVNRKYIDNTKWFASGSAFGPNDDKLKKINSSICYKGNVKFTECEIVKEY